MKKVNKALAQDWHENVRYNSQLEAMLEDETNALYYIAEKRKGNYPSADSLTRLGHDDVAKLVREGYEAFSKAYYLLLEKHK